MLLIFLISLIVGLIVVPLCMDSVNDYLVTHLSERFGARKSDNLSGKWVQNWQVDGDDDGLEHQNPALTLFQLGQSLVGTFHFEKRTYRIRARIENSTYISGTWFDEKKGQVYHGAFQARIEVNQQEINGKWIGFSESHNVIKTGSLKWTRKT